MSYRDDARGQTQDMLQRLHMSAHLQLPQCPSKRRLGISAKTAYPAAWTKVNGRKWMDGVFSVVCVVFFFGLYNLHMINKTSRIIYIL